MKSVNKNLIFLSKLIRGKFENNMIDVGGKNKIE